MLKKSKILSLAICVCFLFEQTGFAQVAGTLDISFHLANLRANFTPDVFRPLHLRYLSYNLSENNFQLFLDKGSFKNPSSQELQDATKNLLNYFLVGVSLPNDTLWVNLRPDAEDQIIDDRLAQTDVGKIMLEADLQLKKDTARFTSPENPEGKRYWDKLYKKAEEIFGSENITIPTLTRPWIVPDEIVISETADSAYIYKATLKVMLEQDYLKDSVAYNFKDQKQKELNEYSSQLIREIIIPKLTKEINSSKRYAALRQVYYSLIMAQWFKARFSGKKGKYYDLINSQNLQNLTSKEPWSKTFYFKEYQNNFQQGEYNIQEQVYTPYGQSVRSYFSGGMKLEAKFSPVGEAVKTENTEGSVVALPAFSSSPLRLGQKMRKILVPILFSLGVMGASEISSAAIGMHIPLDSGLVSNDEIERLRRQQIESMLLYENEEISGLLRAQNFSGLVQLAIQGDSKTASALRSLSMYSREVRQLLETSDLTQLAQSASSGNSEAVRTLVTLSKFSKQAMRQLDALDLTQLVQSASYGSYEAVHDLDNIADAGDERAKEALKNIDAKKFVQSALQGDYESALALEVLFRNNNKEAWELIAKLDLTPLVELAFSGNSEAGKREEARKVLNLLSVMRAQAREAAGAQKEDESSKLYTDEGGELAEPLDSGNKGSEDYVIKRVSGNTAFYSNKDVQHKSSDKGSSPLAEEKAELSPDTYEQELAKAQKRFMEWSDRGGYTEAVRNKASQSLIEKTVEEILRSNPDSKVKVVEVGIGNKDAITFRELMEALGDRAEVSGIELLPVNIPDDLNDRVAVDNILNLNPEGAAIESIRKADIIRISNLVLYPLYFKIAERIKLLDVMKAEMKKDGASLIITRTFKPGYEEGIVYVKKGTELILESFVFTVRAGESGKLTAGADVILANFGNQGLYSCLITNPLGADEEGRLPNYQSGKEAELNSALPGLLASELKKRYPDDVRQIGEMVSINFGKLRELTQGLEREPQKEFHREMAGLIPGAAGEPASSPVVDQKNKGLKSVGGIDFRSLPIVTQAITNLNANVSSSAINNLMSVNLDEEWIQIEGMASAGIIPSAERIKEYVQSSCAQESISRDKDKIVLCISDILKQEEERGVATDATLRDVLVVLESMQGGHELRDVFLGKLI